MEDWHAEASLAVAAATVAHVKEERANASKVDHRDPRIFVPVPQVVRSCILVQACLRRKLFLKQFGGPAGSAPDDGVMEFCPPGPGLAVSLYMCRRIVKPHFVNVDNEATQVAGIVSAKQKGLTMGMVGQVLDFYKVGLPASHMALVTLTEKLQLMCVDAQEDVLERVMSVDTPGEVYHHIQACKKKWIVPDELEERVFGASMKRLAEVTTAKEEELRAKVATYVTVPEFASAKIEVERVFGDVQTNLRNEVEVAKKTRVQFLEFELDTKWSRPFAGPLPPHSLAARRYAIELGSSHPAVKDFRFEEKNHAAALEAGFEVELNKTQAQIRELTKLRREARAKAQIADIDARLVEASTVLRTEIEIGLVQLGADNALVKKRAFDMLGADDYVDVYVQQCERVSGELMQAYASADTSPEAGDSKRNIAYMLAHLLMPLGEKHPVAKQIREHWGDVIPDLAAMEPEKEEPPDEPPPASEVLAAAAKAYESSQPKAVRG
eukprot:gnl/TRDRNA2_/TRDRNA2_168554_c3_seq1.p1 gnl/TRDRNA2_/TRDRNA2_168554_c3~~gnl/TRDRNA2_/TRDRNA2_168554_c3_seq1.p1  ORF type:complete len:516 (-),score=91.10 gnl/TRDRNA2_/TRDRNA2_168554_c3_seq1:36-1520(-)